MGYPGCDTWRNHNVRFPRKRRFVGNQIQPMPAFRLLFVRKISLGHFMLTLQMILGVQSTSVVENVVEVGWSGANLNWDRQQAYCLQSPGASSVISTSTRPLSWKAGALSTSLAARISIFCHEDNQTLCWMPVQDFSVLTTILRQAAAISSPRQLR